MDWRYLVSRIVVYWPEILSLLIAAASLIISLISFHRTSRYQHFEYAPRLEIVDNLDLRTGVMYRAEIENKGMKPIGVKTVFIESGSRADSKMRLHHIVKGPFYLGPDGTEEIEFQMSQSKVEEIRQEFQVPECFFFLRVVYHTAMGNIVEVTRELGGYDEEGNKTIMIHIGRTLA